MNQRVFRFSVCLLAALCLPSFLAAQDVNRRELESTGNKKIEFLNYVGPHKYFDTKAQIRGIGEALGSVIASGRDRAGDLARYGVIHAADPAVKTGFDADIIYLGKGAGVDHIRNLRWIISGYLVKAYGYAESDADLLATFITVYNAVYRGELDYFASRYKSVVMSHLSKQNAGLSVRWDEWADRSRIVIPLGQDAGKGNISTVDTGKLTEEKVTEELRKTDDKGVDARKDIVDLKEREVKENERKIAEEKERVRKEEERIAAEKAKLEEDKKRLADEKKALEDKGDGQSGTLTDKAKDEEAARLLAEKEKELADKEKALSEQDKAVETKKDEIARATDKVEDKKAEIETDRTKIAADQQALINKENEAGGKVEKPQRSAVFLEALSLTSPFARFVSLDLDSGATLKKSDLNTIIVRSLVQDGGSYHCIAGSTQGAGAVRLMSVNAESLAVKAEGKDDIFAGSFLTLKDGFLYAIISKAGRFYLGKFGTDLSLKASSAAAVHPYTSLDFRSEGAAVQLAEGGFAFLALEDLKTGKVLK